ncbi:MAG: hypothetical protein IKJ52_06690 [Muribaculaceae bacterium]|nr:hypothetical protein [Muribaculaceae bacterium]
MTPQELDTSLKDIRNMRNLLVFVGFIPIIYVLLFGAISIISSLEDPTSKTIELSVSSASLVIIAILMWGVITKSRYKTQASKVGLAMYVVGLVCLTLLFWTTAIMDILTWGGLFSLIVGLVIFILNSKIDLTAKITHLTYYILFILFGLDIRYVISDVILGTFAIATIVYPMISSYLAVKWAGNEFFKLMNYEK